MASSDHLRVIDGGSGTSSEAWGSAAWGENLRKETRTLAADVETNYLVLAERLWMIYDTPIDGDPSRSSICTAWTDRDGKQYTSFDRYVDAELGIHYKKAQRLRAIWKAFKVDLNLNDKQINRVMRIGYSKVKELARPGVLTPGNFESWLAKAESIGFIKLSTAVSQYLTDKATEQATQLAEQEFEQSYNGSMASAPSSSVSSSFPLDESNRTASNEARDLQRIEALEPQSRQFSCLLLGDQIETVNLALKRSAELSNSDKLGNNLSLICLDFISTNDFGFKDDQQRLRFLAKFEKLMGYKLVVVDPIAREVVFGLETLRILAGEDVSDADPI